MFDTHPDRSVIRDNVTLWLGLHQLGCVISPTMGYPGVGPLGAALPEERLGAQPGAMSHRDGQRRTATDRVTGVCGRTRFRLSPPGSNGSRSARHEPANYRCRVSFRQLGPSAACRPRRAIGETRDLLPLCRAESATHGCLATVDPDEGTVQRTTGARADQFGRLRARRPPCGRPRGLALSTNLRRGRLGWRW